MPKLWDDSIETHRRTVRDAALDAVAALVADRGLRGVTMSGIAERTGIGRATLYRYFSDVDAVLAAWHEREVSAHVDRLAALGAADGTAFERLEAVLGAYARIQQGQPRGEIAASLHGGARVEAARRGLEGIISDLIAEAVEDGAVRRDVSAAELARYARHALMAASELRSKAAVARLVRVTLSAMRRDERRGINDTPGVYNGPHDDPR